MPLNFVRKKSYESVGVIVITGACCIPGMASLDAEAERIVKQAVEETGIEIKFKTVPVLLAMQGGLGKNVLQEGLARFQQSDKLPLPAVLINGQIIQVGVPNLGTIKSALVAATEQLANNKQGESK